MPKLQNVLPLGIVAATLIGVTMINLDKPGDLSLIQSPNIEPTVMRLKKPGAQVGLMSPKKNTLELFEQKDIVLKLTSQLKEGTLAVSVQSDDGLSLDLAQKIWHFDLDSEQGELNLPLSVYASANGVHYLHIFTEHTNAEGQVSARALASEVRVGEADFESTKRFAKNSNIVINTDQGVISLPSKESIF